MFSILPGFAHPIESEIEFLEHGFSADVELIKLLRESLEILEIDFHLCHLKPQIILKLDTANGDQDGITPPPFSDASPDVMPFGRY